MSSDALLRDTDGVPPQPYDRLTAAPRLGAKQNVARGWPEHPGWRASVGDLRLTNPEPDGLKSTESCKQLECV